MEKKRSRKRRRRQGEFVIRLDRLRLFLNLVYFAAANKSYGAFVQFDEDRLRRVLREFAGVDYDALGYQTEEECATPCIEVLACFLNTFPPTVDTVELDVTAVFEEVIPTWDDFCSVFRAIASGEITEEMLKEPAPATS